MYVRRPMRLLYALGALLLALSGCVVTNPTPGEGEAAPEPAILSLDFVPNTNHTGFYVALDQGWYADEGIDL